MVSSIFVSEKDLDYTNMAVQELLLSETDRFQSLQYERLAKFHGFVLETFCFVYERVDPGLTLSEYIQQGRLITWAGRYQLALDVSNALAYLHSTKTSLGSKDETLHRLLSSNSVLLSKEGDRMRAKLYDYGISNIRNYILDVQGISKIRNEYIPQLDVSQSVFLAPENALHSEIPYVKQNQKW